MAEVTYRGGQSLRSGELLAASLEQESLPLLEVLRLLQSRAGESDLQHLAANGIPDPAVA